MEKELFAAGRHPDYREEVAALVKGGLTPARMKEALSDYHEHDVAEALSILTAAERKRLYRLLDGEALAGVLDYTQPEDGYLEELTLRRRAEVLSRMEASLAAAYLDGRDEAERNTLTDLLSEASRREITLLSSFGKDEIGSKMSTDYIAVKRGLDVRGIMHELIAQAADNDNVSTVYVVDGEGLLAGAIDLKALIRARAGDPAEELMRTSYPYVYANETVEDCMDRLREYSEDSIPVLDGENRLTGVLTAQELARLVEDEIGDDYAKLGGLVAEEETKEPLHRSVGKRLPWLVILFGLGMLVSGVVGLFDQVVARMSLIVSFQSLILGMAGNVGTQSLAVTIRALADEGMSGRQKLRHAWKEARVGLCNGLIVGLLSFVLVGAYLFWLRGEAPMLAFSVSGCTGIALCISMLLSGVFGTAIPMLFQKIKIDPAVASGPFITTVNDLVAVLTYYGLASLLLLKAI
ncbi:MAG: magnesium transporter [Clostridia bacterium]|nr:magnesium transporter [Clostridia bacterium]